MFSHLLLAKIWKMNYSEEGTQSECLCCCGVIDKRRTLITETDGKFYYKGISFSDSQVWLVKNSRKKIDENTS